MAYKTCYRLEYSTAAHGLHPSERVRVDISNTTEATSTTLVELEGTGEPLKTSSDNSGEDKLTPIRGQKATIQFYSTDTVNLVTFCEGDDNRFLVDAYFPATGKRIFKGYLVQDELSEAFQPRPNAVTLIAGDGLGLLKDEALTDTDGDTPRGYFTIMQYIAWCLQKTGLELPIYVANNIKAEHNTTDIFYRSCSLWSKSFEDEIGTCEDCYSVLEKILGEDCYLTQYNGAWYIIRVDEVQSEDIILHEFSYDGTYIGQSSHDLNLFIGGGESMYFINEDATVQLARAVKHVKETYEYQFPQEIIDNMDFDRGDLISSSGDDYRYSIEDWTWGRWRHDNTSIPASGQPYTYRNIVDGYEKERYIVLPDAESLPNAMLRSNAIPIGEKDRGTVRVDFREITTLTSTDTSVLGLLLVGESGQNYAWSTTFWLRVISGTNSMAADQFRYATVDQIGEWQNMSIDFSAAPESGMLYVFLMCAGGDGTDPNRVIHYQGLSFDYVPYINGSYRKYNGQYHKVSQDIASKNTRENDVSMSDRYRPAPA